MTRRNDAFEKLLLYSEVPKYYAWNASTKLFKQSKCGVRVDGQTGIFKATVIHRLYTVRTKQGERFFLHMLFVNVPGPTSFQQLRTVNGVTHAAFRSACKDLNLLENNQH